VLKEDSKLNNGELSPMAESPGCKTSLTVINSLHTHKYPDPEKSNYQSTIYNSPFIT